MDGTIDRDGDCSFPACDGINSRSEFVVDLIEVCRCGCLLLSDVNEADNGINIVGGSFGFVRLVLGGLGDNWAFGVE